MSHYEVGHWINGSISRGTGERRQDIHNPATGAVQGKQPTKKCVVQSLLAGAIIGMGCVLAMSVGESR